MNRRRQFTAYLIITVASFSLGGWLLVGSHGGRSAPVHAQGFEPITCVVTISTSTSLAAVGGKCAAPETGLSIYITDILFATNAGAIAADTFPTLKAGTGGTCGTATVVVWGAMTAAATQATIIQNFRTPIRLPRANELCWIDSTGGSKFLVINGYIAP